MISDYFVARWFLDEHGGLPTRWKDGLGLPSSYFARHVTMPNYEQIRKSQLLVETDFEKKETNEQVAEHICKLYDEKKVSYKKYFTGNKSYHIDSDWMGFDELEKSHRQRAKPALAEWLTNKELAKDFDDANFKDLRLIQIPGEPHRKTKKLKVLVKETGDWLNVVPKEIIEKTKRLVLPVTCKTNIPFKGSCGICELALTQCFPEGTNRHQSLIPNLVAYLPKEKWAQAAKTQNKSITELENWAKEKRDFRCDQLQAYARKKDLGHVCDECLLLESWKGDNNA